MNKNIGYRVILKEREYMKTVIATMINRFGDSIDCIAFTWLVYQVTQSAAWSAIIFGANKIPTIFLQPFAAAIVEGKNKKQIMIITDIIRGVCVSFIATSMLLGFANPWILLTMTIFISCAEAFRNPASTALLPKLLRKEYYEFGLSLNSAIVGVTELIGTGLAGIIIGTFGVSMAIYIDAVTFFLSAFIILFVRIKETISKTSEFKIEEYMTVLKEGFLYIKDKKVLNFLVILALFVNAMLVPMNSLQGPLVSEILHSKEIMLSILGFFTTVGMMAGSFFYPYMTQKIPKYTLISCGVLGIPLYYLVLVFVGRYGSNVILIFGIVGIASFMFGFIISLLVSLISVEFIKSIEEAYLARVSGLYNAVCVAAIPISSFLVSILAKYLVTDVLFILVGCMGLFVFIVLRIMKKRNIFESQRGNEGENDRIFESCECNK